MGSSMFPGNVTYETFIGSTSNVPGGEGLVPAPPVNGQDYVLYGDGGWGPLPDYTSRFKNIEQSVSRMTTYKHPTYTPQAMDLYKITVDSYGHVKKVNAVTKEDFEEIGVLTKCTDSLNSTDANAPLSANQGRVLDNKKMNKTGGEFSDTVYTKDLMSKTDNINNLGERSMRYKNLYLGGTIENLTRDTSLVPATGALVNMERRAIAFNKYHRRNVRNYRDEIVLGRYPVGSTVQTEDAVPAMYCDDGVKAALVIGNGTTKGDSDALRVMYNGKVMADQFHAANGFAFSQYLEWEDGNPSNEDRIGLFVTFVGDKIKKASAREYVAGVVCDTSSIVGNADMHWSKQFVTDAYGRPTYELVNQINEDTGESVSCYRRMVNADFDASKTYVPRSERSEWDVVAMMGMVRVKDDGSCVVGGYCKVGVDGVGTAWTDIDNAPNAVARNYLVAIETGGWIVLPNNEGNYKDITVNGILESDNPSVSIVTSENDNDQANKEREQFFRITRIDTYDNRIRVFCGTDVPNIPITIGITCIGNGLVGETAQAVAAYKVTKRITTRVVEIQLK